MKSVESSYDNLRVSIRVRPPLNRETQEGIPFRSIAIVSEDHKSISLAEYVGAELSELERQRQWIEEPSLFHLHRFTFDSIFDMDSLQEDVYNITAKQAVQSVLEGYNSTIFCYGQTGTGKTYTMEGFTYESKNPNRGIIQRTIQDIFNFIETTSDENTKFIIRCSFLQIYNENISDLLKSDKKNLQIREDKKKGIYVDLLSEWAVRSPLDLYALLRRGGGTRTTSATYMNDVSSRSHAVFQITVEQMTTDIELKDNKAQIKVGKLNLVDLAGSERIRITGTRGQQLEESKKINKSLSCLGNVINALTDKKGKNYIPYRDSKLTRLLQDSLGGNCKTTMIATISPSEDAFSESLSTLYFAQRAKKIKNRPALMDKNNALQELEIASRKYIIEREEKLKLEKKIQMMSEQMITGGHKKIEETPQFQNALKNQIKLYENKIIEIEKQRAQLEEDKQENQEYKEILLQQKNIMNELSLKLNERDEKIAQLINELENSEKNEKNLQHRIQILEQILTEKKIPFNINSLDNNSSLKKNQNFSSSYLPYEVETNSKEFEGRPIIMLSSKEKINELRSIISEQENKIHFLDIVSQKFINLMNSDGNIDINKLMKQMENSKDLYQKINLLEKENQKLKNELNEHKMFINNFNTNQINNYKNNNYNINNKQNNNNKEEMNVLLNYNYNNNKTEDNKNNNIIISNNIKENNNNNLYKHNSIKGISFTPYIQKNNNLNFNYSDDYDNNVNNNKINNNNNLQYLSEKNRVNNNTNKNNSNNEQRLKNKKYINKFINSYNTNNV